MKLFKGLILLGICALLTMMLNITNAVAAEPENGWWWSPARSGAGLDLELQGDLLLVGYFTEVNGERIAYNGVCDFSNNSCSGEFLAGFNATGVFYTLSFPNNSMSGTATIGSDSFAIERFQFASAFGEPPTNLIGSWVVVALVNPVFLGEAIVLSDVETLQSGTTVLAGYRDGTNKRAVASYFPNDNVYGIAVEDSDTTIVVYVLDQSSGLNTMVGTFVITDTAGVPQGNAVDAIATRFTQDPKTLSNSRQITTTSVSMAESFNAISMEKSTETDLPLNVQQNIQSLLSILRELSGE